MRRNAALAVEWVKYMQQARGMRVRHTEAVVKSILQARRSPIKTWAVTAGDRVQVVNGKGTGQQGVVQKVLRKKNQVIVKGVNRVSRVVRMNTVDGRSYRQAVVRENPMHYSNLQLVDPESGAPTRVRFSRHRFGRTRFSVATGAEIPRPRRTRPEKYINPNTDTSAEQVVECTYDPPEWARPKPRRKPRTVKKGPGFYFRQQEYLKKLKAEEAAEASSRM